MSQVDSSNDRNNRSTPAAKKPAGPRPLAAKRRVVTRPGFDGYIPQIPCRENLLGRATCAERSGGVLPQTGLVAFWNSSPESEGHRIVRRVSAGSQAARAERIRPGAIGPIRCFANVRADHTRGSSPFSRIPYIFKSLQDITVRSRRLDSRFSRPHKSIIMSLQYVTELFHIPKSEFVQSMCKACAWFRWRIAAHPRAAIRLRSRPRQRLYCHRCRAAGAHRPGDAFRVPSPSCQLPTGP